MQKYDCSSVLSTLHGIRQHLLFNDIMNYFYWINKCERRNTQRPTNGMSTGHPRNLQLPLCPRTLLIVDVTRLQPFIVGDDAFRENIETLISYNVRNDGGQQDCLYIEQGHLMTPTSFMMHLMVIDPRHSIVVSWTPVRLCSMLPQGSPPLCPPGLPFSTSS